MLLALLAKFAWRPLLAALDARQKMIAKAIDDADQARAELQKVQKDAAKLLAQARVEAEGIVTRGPKLRCSAPTCGRRPRPKPPAS